LSSRVSNSSQIGTVHCQPYLRVINSLIGETLVQDALCPNFL